MKHAKIVVSKSGLLTKPDQPPGKEMRKFRLALGKTQAQFAKAFNIPIDTVRRWEQSHNAARVAHPFMAALKPLFRNLARTRRAAADQPVQYDALEAKGEARQETCRSKVRSLLSALLPFCGPEILNCHHSVSCTLTLLGS
ncbi:DNA-binding transcriptional regulator [Paraburkholderia sp. DHOC27]|uniref:helix-turn-helix domain-containing protein n=1 Tax=Paraburkholderia sp. DHOC27 TaxID=2303330 RepID=UPI000E3C8CFB|nr:hypothetical protein [Paraburkholderia sp. DHOC27]RFU47585.1 hypothetical protein D0B32_08405 [Paraburkholderia sp. DHOC27]